MKNKFALTRFIFGILTIILSAGVLLGKFDIKIVMPHMMICIGGFLLFNGLYFYKRNKKPDGMVLITGSIFVFVLLIKMTIFK